jgi:6-pyruvoyltetrahydropterin/6-carboxytetrahydropterin synthase
MNQVIISKDFTFEASHVLPKHKGKCSRLHGHSWGLTISVIGETNTETGFVCDYGDLKALVEEHVVSKLDHSHLGFAEARTSGDFPYIKWVPYLGTEFYPSSENLVVAIDRILSPLVKEIGDKHVRLYETAIRETCTSAARYRNREFAS